MECAICSLLSDLLSRTVLHPWKAGLFPAGDHSDKPNLDGFSTGPETNERGGVGSADFGLGRESKLGSKVSSGLCCVAIEYFSVDSHRGTSHFPHPSIRFVTSQVPIADEMQNAAELDPATAIGEPSSCPVPIKLGVLKLMCCGIFRLRGLTREFACCFSCILRVWPNYRLERCADDSRSKWNTRSWCCANYTHGYMSVNER